MTAKPTTKTTTVRNATKRGTIPTEWKVLPSASITRILVPAGSKPVQVIVTGKKGEAPGIVEVHTARHALPLKIAVGMAR